MTASANLQPDLRLKRPRRLVGEIVSQALPSNDAVIAVALGGKRGMTVEVSLPHARMSARAEIAKALDGYVFESVVRQMADGAGQNRTSATS